MKPSFERHLGHHTFINNENGSLLRGYSAGQDVAAGGRATVFTCLAGGTLVVTDRGLVPIEEVHLEDRVWDGIKWVSHGGCVYRGERETISSYGIMLTPDHRVLTTKGWKYASEGFDRAEIRLPYCPPSRRKPHSIKREEGVRYLDMPVRLRETTGCAHRQSSQRKYQKLWMFSKTGNSRQGAKSRKIQDANVSCMASDGSAMHRSKMQRLSLRRAWRYRRPQMAQLRVFRGGHRRAARSGVDTGASGQFQGLLESELSLGYSSRTGEQHAEQSCSGDIAGDTDYSRASTSDGFQLQLHQESRQEWLVGGCSSASTQKPEPVYDILNAGSRRAFTVIDNRGRPLLVHNCDEFGAKDFIAAGKDESVMESLHDVTSCIRMVSARYADSGVFHNACENPDTKKNGVHLVLDWKDHPQQSKHSYIVREGVAVALKPEDQAAVIEYHKGIPDLRTRLERKGFKYEGIVRSPWYDSRCLRPTATPRLIASQLDRNPKGAVGKVFASDLLDRMKRTHCQGPVWVGNPVFDSETCKLTGLIPREDGALKLWFRPGIDNSPPLGPFTAGCDIASGGVGAYSSNSVITALDDRTGEQVLEYTIKGLEPRPFARRVVGICMWLRNALLGWEDSGVSGGFAKEIMEVIYYGNVFFRDVTQLGSQKKSRKPGWPCRDADKADMFEMMALAMEQGKFVPRSQEMIIECGEYEWDGEKIVHAPSKNKGAADKNHSDRAIAMAGCFMVFNTDNVVHKLDTSDETGDIPEYGSFLWREQRDRRSVKSGSPGYGLRDIIGY
jgi:hypothetical protein